jgi:hypothetical protein
MNDPLAITRVAAYLGGSDVGRPTPPPDRSRRRRDAGTNPGPVADHPPDAADSDDGPADGEPQRGTQIDVAV